MAALDFPASPTVGQIYTANGRSWKWDGVSWISANQITSIGVTGSTLTIYGSPIAHPDATSMTFANSVTLTAASTKTLTLNGGAGSNGLVIDASNNVGIGTTPSVRFTVSNNSSGAYVTSRIENLNTGGYAQQDFLIGAGGSAGQASVSYAPGIFFAIGPSANDTTTPIVFRNNNATTQMTLNASGNLGLGVTPSAWTLYKSLELGRTGNGISGYISGSSVTINANAYYNSGWKYANSAVASQYEQDSGVHKWYNATSGTAGNAITFTQAMTLDASGKWILGGTSPLYSAKLSAYHSANYESVAVFNHSSSVSPYGQINQFSASSPNNTTNFFYQAIDSTTVCFTIWSNGTTSGRSDSRLKKNIAPANGQLSDILALEVVNYEWNDNISGSKEIGFIAQQVQQVKPGLVLEDENGYLHIKQTPLVPILVKAIQELTTRLEALEAQ